MANIDMKMRLGVHTLARIFDGHPVTATQTIEVGVPSDGAAGTLYESLSQLTCTVDLRLLQQHGGGGATCSFRPGP
jgi:hypothetical protein